MKSGLLLVDLQNDYFPGGRMELVGIAGAAANAVLLLNRFRAAGWPVIHVQHVSTRPGASFFLPHTEGVRINQAFEPRGDERVVTKHYPNSFRDTPLLEILQEACCDHLVICGAMSHMCIDATTRAAFDLGFACSVAEDACATRDLEFRGTRLRAADVHASFMAALSIPYATVAATSEILADLT